MALPYYVHAYVYLYICIKASPLVTEEREREPVGLYLIQGVYGAEDAEE